MDKLESIREEDYGQCDSPKAKKVFINMLDTHLHSPLQSKPKMKSIDGKSINLSSPSSYTSSSPSSTSSLSSTSNVQHQKQSMANQALNGSSEYISRNVSCCVPVANSLPVHSARHSQHAKFQSPESDAATRTRPSEPVASFDAFELRNERRRWFWVAVDVNWAANRLGAAAVTTNASIGPG